MIGRIVGLAALGSIAILLAAFAFSEAPRAGPFPNPKTDVALAAGPTQTVVFAGGCFWGVEAVFEHVRGVTRVTSGYSGGDASTAHYEIVGSGATGHAESVEVVYDPSKVTFGQLLKVFFWVAHDPTQLNYQGPDHGTQYRSAIFFTSPKQEQVAKAYVTQLQAEKTYTSPIVTEIVPLKAFYPAEGYHQDYLKHHPDQAYIVRYDMPKLAALKQNMPELYVER